MADGMRPAGALREGWYAISANSVGYTAQSKPYGRSSLARLEARDIDASHIGYWDGVSWQDVEATDAP